MQTKGIEIAVAKTASTEHFDFQIDTFGKPNVELSIKVIEDLLPPIVERGDKGLQRFTGGGFHFGNPFQQAFFSGFVIETLIEQITKGFLGFVTTLQLR